MTMIYHIRVKRLPTIFSCNRIYHKSFTLFNIITSRRGRDLFGILSTLSSGLSGFGLDEKIDQKEAWKESSKGDGHVGTELNLQSD